MKKDEIKQEIQKCKNDPYYFFTEYVRLDGETPAISQERFMEVWEQYKISPNSILLNKSRKR